MPTSERVIEKLNALVVEAASLNNMCVMKIWDEDDCNHRAVAWIASAHNAILLICPDESSPYRQTVDALISNSSDGSPMWFMSRIAAVLTQVSRDAAGGLLSSFANTVRAEVFDDLLEHARHALGGGRKNEAAAVSSVVFEDTVRRIADKHNVAQKGVKLDVVISSLTTAKVFSAIKAKRARAAADLRNQATHAQWEQFGAEDVAPAMDFTAELIGLLDG
jgi:hypothetical protein